MVMQYDILITIYHAIKLGLKKKMGQSIGNLPMASAMPNKYIQVLVDDRNTSTSGTSEY
jgi:hypothetical protein